MEGQSDGGIENLEGWKGDGRGLVVVIVMVVE